MPEKLLI